MADVRPFRGIRYRRERVGDLGLVTTPPYDVISPEDQARFYDKSPYNVVRLILGKGLPGDSPAGNPHTRAADAFRRWQEDGVLFRDPHPAYYLTTVAYTHQGVDRLRTGLIAAVALEPFDKGIILPHEATYSAIKTERLGLMRACHANFSAIFSIFQDATGLMKDLKEAAARSAPDADFTDDEGSRHKLWRIEDAGLCRRIRQALADEKLYIADGHHRYETALAYRDGLSAETGGLPPDHPARFIMMYLTSMADPGLLILPAHRLVSGLEPRLRAELVERASVDFDVERLAVKGAGANGIFSAMAKAGEARCCIGVALSGEGSTVLMTADRARIAAKLSGRMPEALASLDVSILTGLVFSDYIGLSAGDLDDVGRIQYTSRAESAVAAVREGRADAAFLLNPTRIEQVRRIAEEGLIMPRKTTYFAPKVLTGLVLNDLTP